MVDKIKELEIGGHTGREFQIFKLFTWINNNIVDDIDSYIFFSFLKKNLLILIEYIQTSLVWMMRCSIYLDCHFLLQW